MIVVQAACLQFAENKGLSCPALVRKLVGAYLFSQNSESLSELYCSGYLASDGNFQ